MGNEVEVVARGSLELQAAQGAVAAPTGDDEGGQKAHDFIVASELASIPDGAVPPFERGTADRLDVDLMQSLSADLLEEVGHDCGVENEVLLD